MQKQSYGKEDPNFKAQVAGAWQMMFRFFLWNIFIFPFLRMERTDG